MNSIHPSAQLIGDVRLGTGNTVGPLVVIIGPVTIGDGNWIGTGTVIGAPPEVRDWPHPIDAEEPSSGGGIEIGDRNTLREYVQIHQGWHDVTRVGSGAFIMNQTYVAHDCQLEDEVTLASSVLLAGHVRIGAGANLGLGVSVHQRRYIGDGAMVGMGAVVTRDIPPFAKAYGSPARLRGANTVGMTRKGIPAESVQAVAAEYGDASPRFDRLVEMPGTAQAMAKWQRYRQSE
jgi:UDP-N-acetylglucosamine acyltransferase